MADAEREAATGGTLAVIKTGEHIRHPVLSDRSLRKVMSTDNSIPREMKPAGLGRRFAALILNLVLFFPIDCILAIIKSDHIHAADLRGLILMVFSVLCLTSRWQATPGKRFFSIYVVRAEDGKPISIGRALGRFIVFVIPYIFYMLVVTMVMHVFPSFAQTTPGHSTLEIMLTLPMIILTATAILLSFFYMALPFSIVFDPHKRSFIDKLCRTRVVCGRP